MKKFIIGALVLLIGIPFFSFNFHYLLILVAKTVPVLLILGGSFAVYRGIKEVKEKENCEELTAAEPCGQSTQPCQITAAPCECCSDTQLNATQAVPAPAEESVKFKGNIETLVFHDVACNFATGKNCSVDFATRQEAQAQGYKPCKICMPDE